MLFNSAEFLYFMLIVVPVYWALPRLAQNVFLLAASYYFYGSVHGMFLLLILASTLVDYLMGLCLERDRARRRLYVTVSIVVNLGILCYFKYYNFFVEEVTGFLGLLGVDPKFARLDVVLPVGISFYTFQTMSYTIDVAQGRLRACRNFLTFALFVAFFAQLVAGPIERAGRLLPQFAARRAFSERQFFSGCYLIVYGLLKKIVVADNLSVYVDVIFGLDSPPAGLIVVATVGFAFQIYADFSGYSDIARGVGKVLGIELMHNFNLPYFARTPSEFWKRWHISLSEWIRDYLYIPLGGNRCGTGRRYVNLVIAMTLSGLWHGASMNFVVWGFYHALLILLYKVVISRLAFLRRLPGLLSQTLLWALCMLLVLYGWLLFRIRDFGYLLHLNAALLDPTGWSAGLEDAIAVASQIALYVIPLVAYEVIQYGAGNTEIFTRSHWGLQVVGCAALILVCLVFGVEDNAAFIYFQF